MGYLCTFFCALTLFLARLTGDYGLFVSCILAFVILLVIIFYKYRRIIIEPEKLPEGI